MFKVIWGGVLSLLTGSLGTVSKDLKEAYQAKLNAANDKERIAADERIAILEAQKTTILKAQSDPVERWVRIGFALPFVIYTWKLIIWDKVLSLGVTDGLSEQLNYIFMIVLGGYFIDTVARRFTK